MANTADKVALVTDSTAYLPQDLVEQYHIVVAPQTLVWGTETFKDGIDIQPKEFYERLQKASLMPSTSQVSPAEFQTIFQNLLDAGHSVLAILLSHKLSGTMASAVQALEALPGAPIALVDSQTTAMEMGFHILEAAKAAESGATLKECQEIAERARERSGLVLTVDTLEFLHRGGRIGGGSRFLGTALNIKPILEMQDGRLEAVERVRTRNKALDRISEIVCQRVSDQKSVYLAAIHANAPDAAQNVLDRINGRLPIVERYTAAVSPVVGTHAGPGTVGLAYMVGE